MKIPESQENTGTFENQREFFMKPRKYQEKNSESTKMLEIRLGNLENT